MVAELRARLQNFQADVVTLWLRQRTDWLLGTTLRQGVGETRPDLRVLGWPARERLRMAPWVISYYALVPLAARRIAVRMTPYLDRLVEADHVLIHNHRIGREFLALASLRVARRRGIPFVLSPYHHPRWKGYRYSGWLEAYRAADAVLAITGAERDELERLGVTPERVHVIGGAVDEPMPGTADRFLRSLARPEDPVVLFLGQLYRYKGVAELFDAAEMLQAQGVRFNLVYVGPHTRYSARLFEARKRPWLYVLGMVGEQEKSDALAAATVVCLPSHQESFGRIYLEAWSAGKPVIGTRIPAVQEVVQDGVSGLLVAPGSIPELAAAIRRLLEDPELRRRLASAGRQALDRDYTWPKVIERVERAYDSALRLVGR
jgi:glycosyltransferase involved in cell wall biosynthesis